MAAGQLFRFSGLRPADLATDSSSTRDVLLHGLNWYKQNRGIPDFLILLQPTSPLRQASHIKGALEKFNTEIDMVVSVKETTSNPYYVLFEDDEDGFLRKVKESSATRRQDVPKVWEYNGAIYVINTNSVLMKEIHEFNRVIKYEMDAKDSVDIDSEFDFMLCEFLMKNQSE